MNSDEPETTSSLYKHKEGLSGELFCNLMSPIHPICVNFTPKFIEEYPDVKVDFYTSIPKDSSFSERVFLENVEQTIVKLSSGTAGDIIDVQNIAYQKFANTGMFVNFYDLIKNDPDISENDLYMNVLKAFESEDGGLYVFPTSFSYFNFFFNELITDKLGVDIPKEYPDGISPSELINIFKDGQEKGLISDDTYLSAADPQIFNTGIIPDYVDGKTLAPSFTNEGFINSIKLIDSVFWPIRDLHDPKFTPEYFLRSYGFTTEQYFVSYNGFVLADMCRSDEVERNKDTRYPNATEAVFRRTENGNYTFNESGELLAIPISSNNIDLAWELIKYMISDHGIPETIEFLPINTDEHYENFEKYIQPYLYGFNINRNVARKYLSAVGGDKVMEKYDSHNLKLNVREHPYGGGLYPDDENILKDFYTNHIISAEECAAELQERAEILSKE